MALVDVLESTVNDARRIKEYICRAKPQNMCRLITWYRGDRAIAVAVMVDSDREVMLEVTDHGIYGFGADALALASDAWIPAWQLRAMDNVQPTGTTRELADQMRALSDEELAAQNLHPVTGQPLEHGDLNKLADEGGLERGLLAEGLMVQVVNRAGYQQGSILPFRFAGKHLVWGQERRLVDEGKGTDTDVMRGEISEKFVQQMNRPSLQQVQVSKGLDLSMRERDLLTIGVIHARKLPARVVMLPEGADHLRVLRENNLLNGWTRQAMSR